VRWAAGAEGYFFEYFRVRLEAPCRNLRTRLRDPFSATCNVDVRFVIVFGWSLDFNKSTTDPDAAVKRMMSSSIFVPGRSAPTRMKPSGRQPWGETKMIESTCAKSSLRSGALRIVRKKLFDQFPIV
jgi:hypothetical protein